MKLLTFSTLYPSAAQPQHGVFVENRLRRLVATGEAVSRVVAPVPWVPPPLRNAPRYAALARVPTHEERHGLEVEHPPYLVIPKVGMNLAPWLLYRAARPVLRQILGQGYDFDLIDAHYFYPDGVAAAWLARDFGKPVTITGRGTDLNLIPEYRLPRAMILKAAAAADGLITVCQALKDRLVELGVAADRVTVLRNGVDLDLFRPADRQAARARLGLAGTTLLSVGHLVERKGHHLVIEALGELPAMELLIAGDGPERGALAALASRLGVAPRVRFLGAVPHSSLPEIYGAADILVLASSREGWANVLLEAMACGTPVVATRVWGTPEVVARPEAGELTEERSAKALAAAVRRLLTRLPDRSRTRSYAEGFGWNETTAGQLTLFRAILSSRAKAGTGSPLGVC